MNQPAVLVAGIGNIFLGDDAFGVEVAQRLVQRPQPEGVKVVDFGIRGFDLAYALLDGYRAAIFVDAASRGEAPGTLYTIEADLNQENGSPMAGIETHAMDPVKVISLAQRLGDLPERIFVVGCEPLVLEADEMGLSAPVQAAVDEAVRLVESLVKKILKETVVQNTR